MCAAVIHPFAEIISYFILFFIPMIMVALTGTGSIVSFFGYVTYIDLMNNLGHCNFELIPRKLFTIFPPLMYIMYTPSYVSLPLLVTIILIILVSLLTYWFVWFLSSYHSLHHTQFRANYSLFMPFYDYVYGTMDKSTNTVYESSLKREGESPDVVHLTHLTTSESIYHLRLGFASWASKPQTASQWYMKYLMWPVTWWSMMVTWFHSRAFVTERNIFENLKLQTWAIPRYNIHVCLNPRFCCRVHFIMLKIN